MKQIIIFNIILHISSFSFKSNIQLVQCTSLSDSNSPKPSQSLYTSLENQPSPSPSLLPSPSLSTLSLSSLRTTLIPQSLTTHDDSLIMTDAEGDPISIDSFNLDRKNQGQEKLGAVDPNIKKICDATDNPDLCLNSLRPFLMHKENKGKTDISSLLEMQIKSTQQATQLALASLANKLSKGPNKAQHMKMDAFKDCKEVYNDALDNLQEALYALSSKDIGR